MTNDEIREILLANGFTIKPVYDDLKPYVYEAVRAVLAQASAVGAEPVHAATVVDRGDLRYFMTTSKAASLPDGAQLYYLPTDAARGGRWQSVGNTGETHIIQRLLNG